MGLSPLLPMVIVMATQNTKIKTYKDFQKQLYALKEDESASLLSYFKYCWLHDNQNDFTFYCELIEDELEEFSLKEYIYKFTDDMNIVFRYHKKAEAVIYIKAYGIDVFIHKF